MDEDSFEGTLVLEKLAERGQLDAFFEAIDSDDFLSATALMRGVGIDPLTIANVLKRLGEQ